MKITLEMVDEVINRTGVNYKLAKDALELNEGDVLKAILYIEEESKEKANKQANKNNGHEIIDRLKALVNEGLVHQIIVEKNNKVILDLPIFAGAISAVIFTFPTVAAIITAIATGCEIKIVKKDGVVINFNELTQEKFDDLMNLINKNTSTDCSSENKKEDEADEEDIFESDDDDESEK